MQKYLKKFDAKRVTDDQGVEWFEVPIKEEYGKKPVQAFQEATDIEINREADMDNIKTDANNSFFSRESDKWLRASDYEAKDNAYQYAMRDFPELGDALRKEYF